MQLNANDEEGSYKFFTKVTAQGSYVLFLAVSTVSLSVSDLLSEHSVMLEFSDFKFMRLAGQARLAQFEN